MKTCEHFVNLVGEVSLDLHAGGERPSVALEDDCRDVGVGFGFTERLLQLLHHREIDDI